MERLHHTVWPTHLPHDLPPATHTLDDNLRRSAERLPEKPALVFYGAVTSYRVLDEEVSRIAGFLQRVCGVQKGDRVGLSMQNAPQFVAAFYGIIRAGGVVVPINPMNMEEETRYIVQDAGIRTLLIAQERLPQVDPLRRDGSIAHVIVSCYADALPRPVPAHLPKEIAAPRADLPDGCTAWADMLSANHPCTDADISPGDLCILPYTSGSTGAGKGCMHTHQTTLHALVSETLWFGLKETDVTLAAAPMFHVTGMQAGMNSPIQAGGTQVILPRWDREVAADLIRTFGVTLWPTIPTAVIDFLNRPTLAKEDIASLRMIWGGGISMPEAVAQKLRDMTGLTFIEGYGMTETIAPASVNPPDRPIAQCGGVPLMGTDIVVTDPDSQAILPPGEVGEILISGPQVLTGYWNNPEANAESFVEIEGQRFLRTGDLGRMNEEGYLFIVDRLKRMINASGYKVWPSEVESTLFRHPAIAEACVIGAHDPYRGETVKALVVLQPDQVLELKDLREWAGAHMAAYKVPRLLEIVEALPKSGSGKVLWRELQKAENLKEKLDAQRDAARPGG